jgi:NAD(P)-dependent dehydrogenase (short-subunit alcohol dehydrogenase family)
MSQNLAFESENAKQFSFLDEISTIGRAYGVAGVDWWWCQRLRCTVLEQKNMTQWVVTDIPPQTGRLAIVTGATGGLGYETALALARAGAEVILAARNEDKGKAAVARIRAADPAAKVAFEKLDLASLASVQAFAERMTGERPGVDLLINNAAVMALPTRQTTADGFEMQFGTNYLGHFALTLRLLPALRRGRQPRVVNLSSLAHRRGVIDFDVLQSEHKYSPWKPYSQSKLAMLMFAFELQQRSEEGNWGVISNAAHPGWARTDIITNGPGSGLLWRIPKLMFDLFAQSAADGALPTLYAATAPEARGGAYYGPNGMGERKGLPALSWVAPQAMDTAAAARLWDASKKLTGVSVDGEAARA